MMLGLILSRAGVPVTVLEKHGDFLRDFRGDTVQPSTLRILADLGLLERFWQLPVHKEEVMHATLANGSFAIADFRGLKDFPYLALAPQWDFLNMLAEQGGRYPDFRLMMRTEGRELIAKGGRIVGVRAEGVGGEIEIRADLIVGTDGRHSTMRLAAGFEPHEFGAPIDCLWFRLSRRENDQEATGGIVGKGRMIVMLNRDSYWQIAYVIAKGGFDKFRAGGLDAFRQQLAALAPFLADRVQEIRSLDDLSLLSVQVDRLARWHRPGLLLIGDAAHAMSPIGGVGVNLAIQDAVAAANTLGPILLAGRRPSDGDLARVQKRREWPIRAAQRIQLVIQNRILAHAVDSGAESLRVGPLLRFLLRFPFMRRIPARLMGYGVRHERVRLAAKSG